MVGKHKFFRKRADKNVWPVLDLLRDRPLDKYGFLMLFLIGAICWRKG